MIRKLLLLLVVCAAPGVAGADSVALDNGDVLQGTVVSQDADRIVLDHPVLGRLDVPAARVRATARGDEPLPAPPEPHRPGLLGTGWLRGWDRSLELGVSGAEGNTDNFDLVGALRADYEDGDYRWDFSARYFYSTADNEATKNQGRAKIVRDWLFPGHRWFAYAQGRYDYDQFEAWDHRVSLGAGPGYDILQREELKLRARTGLFVTRTFGSPGRDEIAPEAAFGGEVIWKPGGRHELSAATMLFADLRDTGELRNVTSAAWKILVAEEQGLSVQIGIDNEWESDVRRTEDENDLTYYGSVVLDF
jgi:putative salt-induced outer membrane protein YdiY